MRRVITEPDIEMRWVDEGDSDVQGTWENMVRARLGPLFKATQGVRKMFKIKLHEQKKQRQKKTFFAWEEMSMVIFWRNLAGNWVNTWAFFRLINT